MTVINTALHQRITRLAKAHDVVPTGLIGDVRYRPLTLDEVAVLSAIADLANDEDRIDVPLGEFAMESLGKATKLTFERMKRALANLGAARIVDFECDDRGLLHLEVLPRDARPRTRRRNRSRSA